MSVTEWITQHYFICIHVKHALCLRSHQPHQEWIFLTSSFLYGIFFKFVTDLTVLFFFFFKKNVFNTVFFLQIDGGGVVVQSSGKLLVLFCFVLFYGALSWFVSQDGHPSIRSGKHSIQKAESLFLHLILVSLSLSVVSIMLVLARSSALACRRRLQSCDVETIRRFLCRSNLLMGPPLLPPSPPLTPTPPAVLLLCPYVTRQVVR